MATTITRVGIPHVQGDEKLVRADIAFTGNYATGGENITPAALGLVGPIAEVDLPASTTGSLNPLGVVYNANGSVNLLLYETTAAAAGVNGGLQEKTNGEAYGTCSARIAFSAPS